MRPPVRVNAALYVAAIVSAAAAAASDEQAELKPATTDDRPDFRDVRVVAFEYPQATGSEENPRSSAAGSLSDGADGAPRHLRAVGQNEENR